MDMSRLLVASIAVPLIGSLVILLAGRLGSGSARGWGLFVTLVALLLVGRVVHGFVTLEPAARQDFAVTDVNWLSAESGIDIRFHLGLDGLGVWLYGLTGLLMVTAVLVSWEAIAERTHLFYSMLLLLEAGCLGVFTARDIMLFYVFFEFTLIPLFFLIGIWGSEERRYAAIKFFLFTLAGSLLTFLGLLAIVLWNYSTGGLDAMTFSIAELTRGLSIHPLPAALQLTVFLALFAGFAIKVPLFPLHTWLPLAHVQAPTAGSVFLAGILLKIGTYGFLRFSVPMLPDATATCAPWLLWLSVAGIIYGALVALAQEDMKRLIAYSSVSHLGFCMLGLFALNRLGVQGAVLQMVNHGISTGALFAIVGMLYERYHTREIDRLSGLARRMPWLAFFMLLFTFSSIGLPGLNGFAGELLILLGMFQRAFADTSAVYGVQLKVIAVLAVFGVVLGAWYMLWLVQRVFFGPLVEVAHTTDAHAPEDLSWREIAALTPLAALVFWIGLQPQFFLRPMASTLDSLTETAASQFHQALNEDTQSLPAMSLKPSPFRGRVARPFTSDAHSPERPRYDDTKLGIMPRAH